MEGKPDSFRASVLKGMMHFVELYHGEFSEERLLRALRNIHPVDIYRIGQDDPAKLRGWKKIRFSHLHRLQRQVQKRRTADEILIFSGIPPIYTRGIRKPQMPLVTY